MTRRLWFGDERGYNATDDEASALPEQLWFGDERGYNATVRDTTIAIEMLWFGDERGYNATCGVSFAVVKCCGLVMKEDITQHYR